MASALLAFPHSNRSSISIGHTDPDPTHARPSRAHSRTASVVSAISAVLRKSPTPPSPPALQHPFPLLAYLQLNSGKGSFGEVYKGYDKRTQRTVAIKIIDLESAEDEIEDIQQEIAILSQLDSPHVTKSARDISIEFSSHLWIVMEYCSGGSCSDLMKPGVFREEYIAIICRELLKGLEYLHNEGKLHRDIKAANILLSAGGEVKLADFGVSGQLSGTLSAKKNTFVGMYLLTVNLIRKLIVDSLLGSPPHLPKLGRFPGPNRFLLTFSTPRCPSPLIDSLGAFKADMTTKLTSGPWELRPLSLPKGNRRMRSFPMKVLFLIPKNPPPTLDGSFSKLFREFVSLCLQRDPRDRPTAKELLKHKFVKLAKKTSFLTELIDRHERWKAEGGGARQDEDGAQRSGGDDIEAMGGDSEDLWDFGTVRHVGTTNKPMGGGLGSIPAARSSMEYVGPSASTSRPGMNGRTGTTSSSGSGSSNLPSAASITIKGNCHLVCNHRAKAGTTTLQENTLIPMHDTRTNPSRHRRARVMLDSVVLPAISSLFPRVSREAHVALTNLQRAFEEAERMIPGVTMELVNEIVDSVEHVEDPEEAPQ
ncbi:Serine/Threonine protein kinase, catalytic domain [Rhizoctonia solani]|uniref:Serine/Threonine protein kinase, catalytic domain n=1 Tax=Rhizoctonia solani TaxID=456999 RepID=A0A8H7I444_9AGAM|nr:Serine/Threonine protein kinase, catalytic domain [Rhizoctonia solani]